MEQRRISKWDSLLSEASGKLVHFNAVVHRYPPILSTPICFRLGSLRRGIFCRRASSLPIRGKRSRQHLSFCTTGRIHLSSLSAPPFPFPAARSGRRLRYLSCGKHHSQSSCQSHTLHIRRILHSSAFTISTLVMFHPPSPQSAGFRAV